MKSFEFHSIHFSNFTLFKVECGILVQLIRQYLIKCSSVQFRSGSFFLFFSLCLKFNEKFRVVFHFDDFEMRTELFETENSAKRTANTLRCTQSMRNNT